MFRDAAALGDPGLAARRKPGSSISERWPVAPP